MKSFILYIIAGCFVLSSATWPVYVGMVLWIHAKDIEKEALNA